MPVFARGFRPSSRATVALSSIRGLRRSHLVTSTYKLPTHPHRKSLAWKSVAVANFFKRPLAPTQSIFLYILLYHVSSKCSNYFIAEDCMMLDEIVFDRTSR